MSKRKIYFSLVFCIIALNACIKNVISSIPDYPIYMQLDLVTTYPTFKNSVNQFLLFKDRNGLPDYFRIGYGGVVTNTGIDLSDDGNSKYYAFDLACPFEADNNIRVYPYKTGEPYLKCEKCGSVFDVGFGNGNPISGPAKECLKRYKTNLRGNYLEITRQ